MSARSNADHIRSILILLHFIQRHLVRLYTTESASRSVQFDFSILSHSRHFGPAGFPMDRAPTDGADRTKCVERMHLGDGKLCGYLKITRYSAFISVSIAGSVSGRQDSDKILHAVLLVVAEKCGWLSEEEIRQNAKGHDCETFYDKLMGQNYDDWKT